MEMSQVSIFDLNPKSCIAGDCKRLPILVQQSLGSRVRIQRTTEFGRDSTSSPTSLVLVRPSSTQPIPSLLRSLRNNYHKANVLGLFCGGWESAADAFHSAINDFDDFISCPFNQTDLIARIERLLASREQSSAAERVRAIKQKYHLESLIGESGAFAEVISKVPAIAAYDVTVMILGETGTGKELFARAIHYTSVRRDKPFVPLNCGALPDQLFENELFGHVKGAYTDASGIEKGLLAVAEGGTLFLDEVDTLTPAAQIKLLRFLQDREYRPLGSSKTVVANVRILAATNQDLRKKVEAKLFREDLYHRVNVISISLPSLRERVSDIPLLASHVLSKYGNQHGRNSLRLSPGAIQKLMNYWWPGNVRELEGVIHRAIIFNPAVVFQARDIELAESCGESVPLELSLHDAKLKMIVQFEHTYLANVLEAHQGNISRAAKAAGKERRTFQRLLQKHGLKGDSFR